MKKLMKEQEVGSGDAGAYDMIPESSVFSCPDGLEACKKRGMLASWDMWGSPDCKEQTMLRMLERMAVNPQRFCFGAALCLYLMPYFGV